MNTYYDSIFGAMGFIFLFTYCDVLRTRILTHPKFSWWESVKLYFNTDHHNLGLNAAFLLIVVPFIPLFTHNLYWFGVYGFSGAFFAFMWLRWWWNNKGRKKFAERFAGYKHKVTLTKMGVSQSA